MAAGARKRATYEDVLNAPPNVIAEILFGVLHTQSRPAIKHQRASSRIGEELGGPFDRGRRGGPGGWIILDEPELHLHDDVLVPDLAGWRRARMPELPDVVGIELAPDWVCEVLSPSTAAIDRGEKMDIYAREKISHAWLVDPNVKQLEVFSLDGEKWKRVGAWSESARVRAEPFDAIELELEILWAR